jgi:hypothetical protein
MPILTKGHAEKPSMHGVEKQETALDSYGRRTIIRHDYGWQGVAPAPNKLYRENQRLADMRDKRKQRRERPRGRR